jgi:microcompartment protein CcmK/EutM
VNGPAEELLHFAEAVISGGAGPVEVVVFGPGSSAQLVLRRAEDSPVPAEVWGYAGGVRHYGAAEAGEAVAAFWRLVGCEPGGG